MAIIVATYVDADTFTVATDRTTEFAVGRRVNCDCGVDGEKVGTILSSSYGSPNTTVNLSSGSDNLTSNLVTVEYGIVHYSIMGASRTRAKRSTAQSIPNATDTLVQYNTEDYDNLSEYDHEVNYRFTAIRAGYYLISASLMSTSVAWDANEYWQIALYKNGAVISYGSRNVADAAITRYRLSQITDIIYLVVTDYIDIRCFHDQGAAVDTIANSNYNYFVVHRLS